MEEVAQRELHNVYSFPKIIRQKKSRKMSLAGHVARMEEESKMYTVLLREPERKRPFGRPRRRWEDLIKMILGRLAGGVEWIRLGLNRDWWRAVVNTTTDLRVLSPRSYLDLFVRIANKSENSTGSLYLTRMY
jgi:hypothetical protein